MIVYTTVNHLVQGGSRARGILQCKADDLETARSRLCHLANLSGMKAMRRNDQGEVYFVSPTPQDIYVRPGDIQAKLYLNSTYGKLAH